MADTKGNPVALQKGKQVDVESMGSGGTVSMHSGKNDAMSSTMRKQGGNMQGNTMGKMVQE